MGSTHHYRTAPHRPSLGSWIIPSGACYLPRATPTWYCYLISGTLFTLYLSSILIAVLVVQSPYRTTSSRPCASFLFSSIHPNARLAERHVAISKHPEDITPKLAMLFYGFPPPRAAILDHAIPRGIPWAVLLWQYRQRPLFVNFRNSSIIHYTLLTHSGSL